MEQVETHSEYGSFNYAVGMKRNKTILVAYDQKANKALYLSEGLEITNPPCEVNRFEFIRWATNDDFNVVPVE